MAKPFTLLKKVFFPVLLFISSFLSAQTPVVTITGPATTTACTNTATAFTATATNGPILNWGWLATPSAGVTFTPTQPSSTPNVSVTFTTAGTYSLVCDAANASGAGTQDTVVVTVTTCAGSPAVTVTGPTSGCVGTALAFSASATNGPVTAWSWAVTPTGGTVGTPTNTGTTSNVSITFSAGGTYAVTCTATNASGSGTNSPSYSVTINANGPPTIAISPTTACAGVSNSFTSAITNGGTAPTYQWQVNAANVGTGSTYTSSTLTAGQTVTCILTSNSSCATPTTATSNSVTVTACAGNPTPSITMSPGPYCQNGTVNLFGSVSGGTATSWAWTTTPATGATITTPSLQNTNVVFSTAGTYTIKLTVQPGGGIATATITVNALPNLSITATKDTICKGTSTTLTAATATSYQWAAANGITGSPATASVVATPTVTTTYTVTGVSNSCTTQVTKNIVVLNNTVAVASATNYYPCLGSNTILLSAPTGATSYSWSPAASISCINCPNPTVTPVVAGTTIYTLTVTGKCITTTTDTVSVTGVICSPPTAHITMFDHEICRLECVQFVDSSYYAPLQYTWVFEGGIPDTSHLQNPVVCYNVESSQSPSGNGYYYVKLYVKNILNQIDSTMDSIKVDPSPLASINNNTHQTTIQTGDAVTLDAASWTGGASSYVWTPNSEITCDSCGVTVASPLFTTTYIVQASNALGCSDYDTIIVKVDLKCGDVFVPNAFSPNGDGHNDLLHVRSNCINQMLFKIYNRWGEVVFQTDDPTIGWDGTFQGKPMDAGVFVYYIEGNLKDKERTLISQKGNITLVR